MYTVEDIDKSVAWYRDVFGGEVAKTFENEGKVVGAAINYGQIGIWLSQDDFKKGRDRQKGEGFRIILETEESVDELAAGIKERGGELLMGPEDRPWGSRVFAVADPDGYKISVSTPFKEE
jgi:lactoylglutathione lyase